MIQSFTQSLEKCPRGEDSLDVLWNFLRPFIDVSLTHNLSLIPDGERMNFCWFKPPSVWQFVLAALGNSDTSCYVWRLTALRQCSEETQAGQVERMRYPASQPPAVWMESHLEPPHQLNLQPTPAPASRRWHLYETQPRAAQRSPVSAQNHGK